jgi:hypothetical protein
MMGFVDRNFRLLLTLLMCVVTTVFLTSLWPGFYDKEDLRPIEEQIAEAREKARDGHRFMLKREALNSLKPGDIVMYDKKLWLVRFETRWGVMLINLRYEQAGLDINDSGLRKYSYTYKKDTDIWRIACQQMVLEGVPKANERSATSSNRRPFVDR